MLQIDPNVNVIVISGIDLEEVRKELFDLGLKMFITKPFQIEAVAEVLRTLSQPVAT